MHSAGEKKGSCPTEVTDSRVTHLTKVKSAHLREKKSINSPIFFLQTPGISNLLSTQMWPRIIIKH